jgi:hypothetical protein
MAAFLWVFMASEAIAWYPATYGESAHGDGTYGVNRSGAGHDIGSCANCHDTFDPNFCENDPNDLMLFYARNPTSQTDNFCFQCHKVDGSVQEREGGITNYDYGSNFGGGEAMSNNIKDAFNFGLPNQAWTTGSSHNLQLVRNWTRTKPPGDWITDDTNACLVCHDPHLSQKNSSVVATGQGGIKTAIRRVHAPSSGTNQPGNLWGDESGSFELMEEDPVVYQAPYFGDSNAEGWEISYEPAGDDTSDGSNLPNFVRFCAYGSCHSIPIPNAATDADPESVLGRDLRAIDWTSAGSVHGSLAGSPKYSGVESCSYGSLKEPYDDPNANYVLACTDCHEPHGSEGAFLLRRVINGKRVPPIKQWLGTMDSVAMWEFCTACHNLTVPCGPHQCDNIPDNGLPDCSEVGCGYCHDHSNFL